MTQRIIYVNQRTIPEKISNIVKHYIPDYNHTAYSNCLALVYQAEFYCRAGTDVLPYRYDSEFYESRVAMPDMDVDFKKSFGEITDQRCRDLVKQYSDRPWVVMWSGGIDSTVILTSLLKNLSASELNNVVVSCNSVSVYENPQFFHNHIVKNFKTMDSSYANHSALLNNYYVIDGNPADLMFSGGLSVQAQHVGLDLTKSWKDCSGALIDYLGQATDATSAELFYNLMAANLHSTDPRCNMVQTLADWFWWINFNWKWISDCWRALDMLELDNTGIFVDSFVNWFDSWDYQQWAMTQGRYSVITDGPLISDYKKTSKHYIYEFDRNPYYLNFKTKCHSTAQVRGEDPWHVMLDDMTTLHADRDFDLIEQLLPAHLNVK